MSDLDEDYYTDLLKEKEVEDAVVISQAINVYRDKQRLKKEWGRELENWQQLGVQARRDRRTKLRKKRFATKAEAMAQEYVLTQNAVGDDQNQQDDDDSTANAPSSEAHNPKEQLEKGAAFFQRLLEHMYEMEQGAYERGKKLAIQREADKASGTATDVHEYLQELELVRETEQEKRRLQKEHVFELPHNWELLEDDELIVILKIRGNIRNVAKVQKRETIVRYVRESFAKSLF